MMLMPDPCQSKSSDCALRITLSGRVAGPAAKLKSRFWEILAARGGDAEGEERAVQVMEKGFFEMGVGREETLELGFLRKEDLD